MVKQITVQNLDTGQEVFLSAFGDSYYVLDEIDWDLPSVSFAEYELPEQIGSSVYNTTIGTKVPKITGYVVAAQAKEKIQAETWEEYYSKAEKRIEENKKNLNKILNPLHTIRVIAGEYYLEGKVSGLAKYSMTEEENNEVLCKFSFEFKAFNSMFRKIEDEEGNRKFSVTEGMFHFPMVWLQNNTVFGVIGKSKLITITNSGDVSVGAVITIDINGGTAVNPSFFSAEDGAEIKFIREFENGEQLVIDTRKGEEDAYVITAEGEQEDLLGYLSDNSTFVQISQGEGRYGYTAESETDIYMTVSVNFEGEYFYMEGM